MGVCHAKNMGIRERNRTRKELHALLEPWLTSLSMRSAATARGYGFAVSRFLEHLDGTDLELAVADFLASLQGLAPATRAHYVSAVRTFIRHAKARGVIPVSFEDGLVRPRVDITSYGRYLDGKELGQLLRAARSLSARHLATVAGMALTGVRVSELANATWRDLYRDPEGRLGLRVLGKGGKSRVVKVRDDLFTVLAELHRSEELDASDTSPLVPDRSGTRYTARGLHGLVAQSVKASGIKKPASPHWLRHSHATLAAANGASVFTIQGSLGHSRIETSQRYVHMARGLADTTVDSLPSFAT